MSWFFTFKNFFTGLWPMVWHFGSGGVAVALMMLLYFASPVWLLPGLRRILPWLSLAIVVYLVGLTIGAKDELDRCNSQIASALGHEAEIGAKIRADAEHDIPLVKPPAAGSVRHNRIDTYDRGD